MRRSTMLALTFVIVMAGTMFLMQRLVAQQGPDVVPYPETKGPVTKDYVVQVNDTLPQQDYNLGHQAMEILAKYQGSEDSAQREKLRAELQKIVSDQFDLRQQLRQKELEKLEAQVRRLRNIHARRQEEKDSIIKDRVQQLLRDADGLGWGSDNAVQDDATHYDMLQQWPAQNYPNELARP